MASSSCTGRKCFHSVSKVGPITRMPPSPETSIASGPGAKWSVATALVVLFAAVAVAAMLVALLAVLRRKRLQRELLVRSEVTVDNGDVGKPGQGEEGVEREGHWSAGPEAVELVVMAGETKPTYLATPTIQCPPLMIQAKAEDQ